MTVIANLIDWLGRPGLAAVILLLGIVYVYVFWSIVKEVYLSTQPPKK